jgi:uncharacterized membrane protein YdbT with pleckstrin-like domain
MSRETTLWSSSPSQIVNLGSFILAVFFFWLIIPPIIAGWRWLVTRNTIYELTSERLRIRTGVINKQIDDLELYRVRDFKFTSPLILRLYSLGNITLETSDSTHPSVIINAVGDAEELIGILRQHVENCRVAQGVREFNNY